MNTSQFTLETLTRLLEEESLDVLLIEGFHAQVSRRSDIFKVVAAKDENDATNTLEGTSPPILAITGVITTHQHPSEIAGIPVMVLERNGRLLVNHIAALEHDEESEDSQGQDRSVSPVAAEGFDTIL